MDDKWVYYIHYFEQGKEIKAIGIVRTLVWKKSIPTALSDIMEEVGATEKTKATEWLLKLFEDDKEIIAYANKNFS